jgi:hypothetical protein
MVGFFVFTKVVEIRYGFAKVTVIDVGAFSKRPGE